jgi:hypothetical protein
VDRRQLLKQLDKAWVAFNESYAGLSDAQLMAPGVTGAWSVRDILAHVTTWEEEALKHLLGGRHLTASPQAPVSPDFVVGIPIRRNHRKCDARPARNDLCSVYLIPNSRQVSSTTFEIAG